MRKIYIYAPDSVVEMSIALMKDLCWVASSYALEQSADSDMEACDFVKLVSQNTRVVRSFSGNEISTDLVLGSEDVEDNNKPDAILIGAYWGPTDVVIKQNQNLLDWLVRSNLSGIPIAAVSNAPMFLAEAGLLDNKVATVYPPAADAFRKRYPSVVLKEERAITDAGALYCANGIASGCDLIVSIIEQMYGPEIARRISNEFLLGFNRSYTLANVNFDGQKYHKDHSVLLAQQMIERDYCESINLQNLAENIGMSPRNFSRRFKQATGETPSEYLQRVRVEAAKDLLTNTRLSISEVAYRSGFSDVSHLGRMFVRYEGCRPNVFRKTK